MIGRVDIRSNTPARASKLVGESIAAAVGLALSAVAIGVPVDALANGGNRATPERGYELVSSLCSGCHAVTRNDRSKHKDAPAFRDVVDRYPPEALAEALAEGIVSGHPDMPVFVFEPDDISAIIGYLDTLQD